MSDYLGNLGQAVVQTAQQMNQGMAQLNANLRQMGDGAMQAINGYYMEAKRFVRAFDEQRGLRYRPATITLSAQVAPGVLGGSADFRVAQNEDFLVMSVRGLIGLDLVNEPAAPANLAGSNTAFDRMLAKAQNVRVAMMNKDTKVPIMENESISLATICPEVGGEVLVFGPNIVPAFIIPHNMTIQATFALQSNNAFFTTASTNYGITLTGAYISREVR